MLALGLLLLTAGAVAAIIVPLVRRRGTIATPRAAFDRAVYRDQLAEIDRDRERGILDSEQARAARIEVERRLLATDETGEAAAAAAPVGWVGALAIAAVTAVLAVTLYLRLGAPELPDQPLASRHDATSPGDLPAVVDALAARLKERPEDGQGWLLLARSQASLQRWQESAASYQRALALTNAPEAAAGYGEMLVVAADGVVTPAARSAFAAALSRDPSNPPARFYLALGDAQAGKAREAVDAWARMADEAPAGAPWLPLVRRHIEETAREAGIALPANSTGAKSTDPGAAGPSAADIEAAQAMTPEQRQAMIRTMVERLAARLESNPDDAEGWHRLARAYTVLGEAEKAAAAEARAAALAKPQP